MRAGHNPITQILQSRHFSLIQRGLAHIDALRVSLQFIATRRVSSALTITAIAFVLTLPALLFLFVKNLEPLTQGLENGARITLYLHKDTPPTSAERLAVKLQLREDMLAAHWVSARAGLQELASLGDFQHLLQLLPENPLPEVIEITPNIDIEDNQALQTMLKQLLTLPDVSDAKLDSQWIRQIQAILQLSERCVWVLFGLFIIGIVIIISQTLKHIQEQSRRSIYILEFLGATKAYIRRPYAYYGLLIGLLGGLLALVLITVTYMLIEQEAITLAKDFNQTLSLSQLTPLQAIILLTVSASASWLGARLL